MNDHADIIKIISILERLEFKIDELISNLANQGIKVGEALDDSLTEGNDLQ